MAYVDKQHTHKRLAGITGVALIHIALAFGLVFGLAVDVFAPPTIVHLPTRDFPLPPAPTPDDPPPPDAKTSTPDAREVVFAPKTLINLADNSSIETTIELPPIGPIIRDPGLDFVPPVRPDPPAFTPRAPSPSNGPQNWVTNNDYPRRALQRGWEGDLSYALSVNADGRVDECRVVSSAGRSVLDDAACRQIKRRARFDAATDSSGNAVAGTYRGMVSWQIPDN